MERVEFLRKIVNESQILENIYDCIRLVDPIEKKVYSYLKFD